MWSRAGSAADPAVAPHPRLPLTFAHHRLARGSAVPDPPTPRQPLLGGGGSDAVPASPCKISSGSAVAPDPPYRSRIRTRGARSGSQIRRLLASRTPSPITATPVALPCRVGSANAAPAAAR
uniref:Uncharacterized protein n=1 Tax=Oryza meridionalis TaxID=40149 RepID=A0A0E0E8Y5_9ORYZ